MYEQFYGFSARPFQLTPDPKFYFESASQRKAVACLEYGLEKGRGFVAITGDAGTGKSTLVKQLLSLIDREAWTVAQVNTSAIDSSALVHAIAKSFGLSIEGADKANTLSAIHRFLLDETQEGRSCLLLIDECQGLDSAALEELRELSDYEDDGNAMLQIILLGQSQFRRVLAQNPELDQLRQRIVASHNLEAMDEREVGQYVRHRLEQVGWPNRPILGEGLIARLHEVSEGIPRRVNQVMNRLLLLGAIEEEPQLTVKMLQAVCEQMASEEEAESAPVTTPASTDTQEVERVDAPQVVEDLSVIMDEREERTAELEAAISGLQAMAASSVASPAGDCAAAHTPQIEDAIERIENRLEEQERSLRHVLTMLIEWLEEGEPREAA